MRSYSQDLRMKVLGAYDRGMTTNAIAEAFGVSPAWARRVRHRRRKYGELGPRPRVGPRRYKIDRTKLSELSALLTRSVRSPHPEDIKFVELRFRARDHRQQRPTDQAGSVFGDDGRTHPQHREGWVEEHDRFRS